jgi:hypothetical protein
MSFDSANGRFYNNSSYSIVGTYSFVIWACDKSNNWVSANSEFEIVDSIKPMILDVAVNPNPQEVYQHVNISAIIDENHELSGVFVNITYPNGLTVNQSMKFDNANNRYYLNSTYSALGTHYMVLIGIPILDSLK